MKTTKIYLLLAFVISSIWAFSQDSNGDSEKTPRNINFTELQIAKMKQDITLDLEQELNIRNLLDSFFVSRERIKDQTEKSIKEKIKELKIVYDLYKWKLNAVYTMEQLLQLKQKAEIRVDAGIHIIKELSENKEHSKNK